MKIFSMALLALTLSAPMAFAHDHGDCKCDKKCEQSCKEHKGKKCKCDDCECKEGHCKHGHCDTDHKKGEAKTEAAPAPEKK